MRAKPTRVKGYIRARGPDRWQVGVNLPHTADKRTQFFETVRVRAKTPKPGSRSSASAARQRSTRARRSRRISSSGSNTRRPMTTYAPPRSRATNRSSTRTSCRSSAR
jgi:hypothetical protein